MAILSRSLPGSVPPRIPRKRVHQNCWFLGEPPCPPRGLLGGNPRPPCHSCRGIPAPWACHSGKVVPAPRLQHWEGIPAHPGGSEHPLRGAARSSLPVPVRAGGGRWNAARRLLPAPPERRGRSEDARDRASRRNRRTPAARQLPAGAAAAPVWQGRR